jgi:uncharacterized low-complexity protein
VTTLLNRLGSFGLLVVASALLVGGLAGAAVAHHFDRLASTTTASQPGEQGNGSQKSKPQHGNQGHGKNGHGKSGHANNGDPGGTQSGDPAETD